MNIDKLNQAMQEIVESGFAGLQVRVNDPQGEWVGSASVAELGGTEPPSIDGHFRIGSNTKTFVATVVLQLVADGKVGLDTPVTEYLPEFGIDPRITVRMLLQHTSGLFNHTGEYYDDGTTAAGIPWQGQEFIDRQFHTYEPEELVRLSLSKPSRFEPGTDWSYANTNYVIAQLLIEKVTGHSYGEEMRLRIFQPLGLTGTIVPGTSPELPEPHAHGYYHYEHDGEWKLVDVTRFNVSWVAAGGEMISTTKDMHTFFSALMSGKLVPEPLLAEMRTPHPKLNYGLGLFAEKAECGRDIFTHNGGFAGWGALMYSTPDGKTTLTASLTVGDAKLDFVATAMAFQAAQKKLVNLAFCA